MVRLFVAIDIPDSLRERLALMCGGLPGARWVQPENMHLTLRFIGEVGNGQAEDIDMALSRVRCPGFAIRLEGMSFFGKVNAARMLWAGVARSEILSRLYGKVDSAVFEAGGGREDRKFCPHVTLARLRNTPADRLQRYVAQNATFQSEPIEVDRFVLYSSFLSSSGAIYTPEAEYPLDG